MTANVTYSVLALSRRRRPGDPVKTAQLPARAAGRVAGFPGPNARQVLLGCLP